MAKSLNLSSDWLDSGTLRVSWTDTKANDNNLLLTMVIPLICACIFFFGIFLFITGGTGWFIVIGFILIFVSIFWSRGGSISYPNHVDFSPTAIKHGGRTFSTHEVTRFEYGLRTSLTGAGPMRDGQGQPMSDPTIIRMWIGDSDSYDISQNNWQVQVNHKIRDALSRALETVRDLDKKKEHEAQFGKVADDTGMPDY